MVHDGTADKAENQKWKCILCDTGNIERSNKTCYNHFKLHCTSEKAKVEILKYDPKTFNLKSKKRKFSQMDSSLDVKLVNDDPKPNPEKRRRIVKSKQKQCSISGFAIPELKGKEYERFMRFVSYWQILHAIPANAFGDGFWVVAMNILRPGLGDNWPGRDKWNGMFLDARVEEVEEVMDEVCCIVFLCFFFLRYCQYVSVADFDGKRKVSA